MDRRWPVVVVAVVVAVVVVYASRWTSWWSRSSLKLIN